MLRVAALLAVLAVAAAGVSSPRKFFLFSNSNTRGPNFVKAYVYFYVSWPEQRVSARVTLFFRLMSAFGRTKALLNCPPLSLVDTAMGSGSLVSHESVRLCHF